MTKDEKQSQDKSDRKGKKDKKEKNAPKDSDALDENDIEEEVQRLLDSGVWKAMMHNETGKTYYYHTETKQTCWNLKKELLRQRKSAAEASKATTSRPNIETTSGISQRDNNKEREGFVKYEKNSSGTTERRRDDEVHSNEGIDADNESTTMRGYATSSRDKRGDDKNKDDSNKELHTLVPFNEERRNPLITETYKDPLERLMSETNRLEQLMASSGTSQSMALEFQRSYEALARTNKALTAQMVKMKQEYDAMDMALRDANMKVYEKDLALREAQSHTRVVNKEEETLRTLAFLREQNQELVRQVGELTVALSRGFNEVAYQQALCGGQGSMNPEAMAANPPQLRASHPQSLGATLDSLVANPVVQKCLCSTCSGELERLRLSLLPHEERATSRENEKSVGTGAVGAHHARYTFAGAPAASFDRLGHPVNPCQTQQTQQPLRGYSAQDFLDEGYGSGKGYPLQQQQQQQRGIAPGYSNGYVPPPPVPTDRYGDHFPEVTVDRRSVPQASMLSASPVFGGFRIRPAY